MIKRTLGILGFALLLAGALWAQADWSAGFDRCLTDGYRFRITNESLTEVLRGSWSSGSQGTWLLVAEGETQWVQTRRRTITFDTDRGSQTVHAPTCHPRGPMPAYLLAAPGVSGPAIWACNGSRVNHPDGSPIVTPGQTFVWQGVETPVTVLILSRYIDPALCSVEGAAPAWYVDYTRWTCLAYTGDDAGCGGAADFH